VIRKVTLVISFRGEKILSENLYKSVSYFRFPQSDVLYEDLPTCLNSENTPIIDVSLYYSDEK
jgi:hypothetical protein